MTNCNHGNLTKQTLPRHDLTVRVASNDEITGIIVATMGRRGTRQGSWFCFRFVLYGARVFSVFYGRIT